MNKILAIIVTYNRVDLLKRCLNSLRDQTCKDFDILVVNNGSTDGTKAFLESLNDILVINQENVGGAGGFYAGMKYAQDNKYDWVWMMDDDGVADNNQLKYLFEESKANGLLFANALVCNINNREELAFGLEEGSCKYRTVHEAQQKDLIECINPFNGTFINMEVLNKIGLVKKEMFIWGDENEYYHRAMINNIETKTVTKALHYHPKIKGTEMNIFPLWSKYTVRTKPFKMSHIFYRNLGYIYNTYYPKIVRRLYYKYMICFILHLKINELLKFRKYYLMGMNNEYE